MTPMQTWQWVALGLTVWCLAALVLAAVIGRTVDYRDHVEGRQQRYRRTHSALWTLRRRI